MKEYYLLKMRECIALIEAETAIANREICCLGSWRYDHELAIAEFRIWIEKYEDLFKKEVEK